MVSAAVHFYDVIVFVHILSVLIAFGPPFAYGMFTAIAEREGRGESVLAVGKGIIFWDRVPGTVGMTLVLLSGIYLASDGPYGMGSFFISWGFVAIVVLFGFAHGFFVPRVKRLLAVAERDLEEPGEGLSPEYHAISAQIARVGMLAAVIVVLTIYVMTAKPFL